MTMMIRSFKLNIPVVVGAVLMLLMANNQLAVNADIIVDPVGFDVNGYSDNILVAVDEINNNLIHNRIHNNHRVLQERGECENDLDFLYKNIEGKDCLWALEKPKNCNKRGSGGKQVRFFCPQQCKKKCFIDSPTLSPTDTSEMCTMPLWMTEPLKSLELPEVFRGDPTDFLPDKSLFEIVEPSSDDYCKAFNAVDATADCPQDGLTCPGAALFGDLDSPAGPTPFQKGLGGINNFAVIKVKPDALVELYASRKNLESKWHKEDATKNPNSDFWNTWFGDYTAFTKPFVDFSAYSNNRMALAGFSKTEFAKCVLKPGALVIIGSGASRNSIKTGYYTEDGHTNWEVTPAGTHIKVVQTPEARFLQYILDVKTAAQDCSYWPLNAENMWQSMEGDETQFLSKGEYVEAK